MRTSHTSGTCSQAGLREIGSQPPHETSEYQAMLRHLRNALKADGRLVIIDPISEKRREQSRDQQTRDHEIAIPFVD